MQVGIVGLPYVGKTTVFNALTGAGAETGGFSAKKSANVAAVKVPDERVWLLGEKVFKSPKITPATIEYLDFVGISRGSVERGELDRALLGQLRDVDEIVHVVRAFRDESVPHVEGSVDPVRDIESLELELILADAQVVENRLSTLRKEIQAKKDPALERERDLLERCREALENEVPLRELEFSPEEERISRGFGFLTRKPMLIVLNIGEDQLEEAEELMGEIERFTSRPGCAAIPICAKLEEEIAQLEEDEAEEFLREMGLGESALNRMIKASYELLDLITFFTGNERETRAWTARRGTTAVKAAGMIHSDMERGFIRAEVINWRDLLECGSYSKARQEGKLRIEGKDYVVQDGDVLLIRFNV
ncbi:redox-regulated ATPase YchF [Candidatus Poribacteria bacterium]|nr:MAG: redox-regulated ATPase YchF [Candidatus Poribacteria bacterium]